MVYSITSSVRAGCVGKRLRALEGRVSISVQAVLKSQAANKSGTQDYPGYEGLQREDSAWTFARTRESHIDYFTVRRGGYTDEARIAQLAAINQHATDRYHAAVLTHADDRVVAAIGNIEI